MPAFVEINLACPGLPVFVNPDTVRMIRAAPDENGQSTSTLVFVNGDEVHVSGAPRSVAHLLSWNAASVDED